MVSFISRFNYLSNDPWYLQNPKSSDFYKFITPKKNIFFEIRITKTLKFKLKNVSSNQLSRQSFCFIICQNFSNNSKLKKKNVSIFIVLKFRKLKLP